MLKAPTMLKIVAIPIIVDNYAWLLVYQGYAWVVDPGEHTAVIQYLTQHQLSLQGIMVTHHHWDHISGIQPLQQFAEKPIPVYGPYHPAFKLVDRTVSHGDRFAIGNHEVNVIATPGHTFDHVSFWLPSQQVLFCGDTLFNCGCGRVTDGNAKQLFQSLQAIKALPKQTKIHCTHEYTLANIHFAKAVEPDNAALHSWQTRCEKQRNRSQPTLPSTLEEQLIVNPFLRTDSAAIRRSIHQQGIPPQPSDEAYFIELRRWKDRFSRI